MRNLNPFKPPPAPSAFAQGKAVPDEHASILSRIVFEWLSPFLYVGFTRPLEKDDLWELPPHRLTHNLTDVLERNFYLHNPANIPPPLTRSTDPQPSSNEKGKDIETKDTEKDSKDKEQPGHGATRSTDAQPSQNEESKDTETKDPDKDTKDKGQPGHGTALVKAFHRTFFRKFWFAGICKVASDTLNTCAPLVNRALLTWLVEAYVYHRAPSAVSKPRGVGYGIGLAFALFAMQEIASLLQNYYMFSTMTIGMSVRSSVIGMIVRKSLRLSARARSEHSVGQITTMVSTDSTRLDLASGFVHNLWVAPIQLTIGIALLIHNLGYSALVGLGVMIFGFPLQALVVAVLFAQVNKGIKITDKRVRLTTEILQGIRLIKLYAWEAFYVHQINIFRKREIKTFRIASLAIAVLISSMTIVPTLATVLSFITYALTKHPLNPAIIFSSLQLFNIIRQPLVFLPFVLSIVVDASVALKRVSTFLVAEELEEPYPIEMTSTYAVDADGDFTWETTSKDIKPVTKEDTPTTGFSAKKSKKGEKIKKGDEVLPVTNEPTEEKKEPEEPPFALKGVRLQIPKGSFVAFVGRVGCGKSSVLQALIGEMRRTRGNITFGGSISYVPQTAWIMNATLRENVLFGLPYDENLYDKVIRACCLVQDMDMLPHRDQTEIGEKGINLSGGQKARVSLARVAYSGADIVLLDDPLSAVDAHVGQAILEGCLLNGPLANRTRVLVTHALHPLLNADHIFVMDNGLIVEQGSYMELMQNGQIFARLIEEWGNSDNKSLAANSKKMGARPSPEADIQNKYEDSQPDLMQEEERYTGAVSFMVYRKYLKYAGGISWAPFILFLLTCYQASQVANNLFLGYWTEGSIKGFSQGDYMAVYAGLGVALGLFACFTSYAFCLAGLVASLNLFNAALEGVLRSPVSFFDTTPMGRITSRLSKDQGTMDTELAMTMFGFLSTFSGVIGTIGLVFYVFPRLGIIFIPIGILYYIVSIFYRRSSVETKRLDSLMRSALYASFSETLTGRSTVRASREQDRFIKNAEGSLDLENRAYFMTIAIQRWLSVRLDLFGNILILGVAIFAAVFRNTVNPSKIGVVLSHTLGITQVLSEVVSEFAQNEQNMNSVERILVYAELTRESALTTPNDPPPSWPERGDVKFSDVTLSYREGLPAVLKGVSFQVLPGEKVGIVGRTGAGKSSLLQALFRMVEISDGKILIDGVDIRTIGLDVLRRRLAVVPQDSTLLLGSLRENLDPEGARTDAEIISALQRSWLLPQDGASPDPTAEAKFSLDTTVSDEGSNFSAGEKQLLSLCRALLKDSQIIVLDEATSSIDIETDSKLQRTIQKEFSNRTLLCIAHRLNTIVYYDRVLVMDAGQVEEFDTPLNLFDREDSIFQSLCDEAGLSRSDIVRIRMGFEESGHITTE
ncbi:multidrug resistance-associated ABC transporter [Rickenella mellea]|uniref:Multidrug resistance-associated ABC transporter n=1 Tax=Rickenella mellea TaxID=50990 RepID=A0A4Y7QGQ5_9AGAM|nr:multidrug resistance-associated ABC transporter [Rickenella mellea]